MWPLPKRTVLKGAIVVLEIDSRSSCSTYRTQWLNDDKTSVLLATYKTALTWDSCDDYILHSTACCLISGAIPIALTEVAEIARFRS